jgi:3',5'-cyclic AMP phosphodiesterase CpdA
MERRTFMTLPAAAAAAQSADFTFVHFTDTHIQNELRAREGCEKAFAAINAAKPDFCLAGGDLLMDIDSCSAARTKELLDLWARTVKGLKSPVHAVPGNHDVYGNSAKSPISPRDPMYGKKLFEDQIGPRYHSFDHKGWHFICLDSIGSDANRDFIGEIDAPQMDWLKADVAKTPAAAPIVVLTHIPLATAAPQFIGSGEQMNKWVVGNGRAVLDLFANRKLKAVLQGHTHIIERLEYQGCQYITSGAVSGGWWKGARNGDPEGFGVLTVKGEAVRWEYRTYGWKAA